MPNPSKLPSSHEVISARLPYVTAVTGLSRSAIYRAITRGDIKVIKLGRSTLVMMDSVRAYLRQLAAAQIGSGRGA